MDARELTGLAAPLQQDAADMTDPRQHFAWALNFFPSPNQQMGDVPIHPTVRPGMSQMLWDLGYRHQPELQTKWFVPGDHPEAGYLNVPTLVDAEQYQQYHAVHEDPETENEKWRDTAEALLGKLDPKLVERIRNMTPEERAAAAEVQRQQLPAAFDRLAELKKQLDGEQQ
ncbi:hypothetical protein [Nocardia sp. NPDC019302]|uniref:phage gene 29 protein family protein n=1 Tax=Nocardia sp. NPDC019302 TaxID=3154592 RepID=UPI0033ECEA87